MLNFCYLKIIHILHPLSTKIIGHILKNKQKNNCACIHRIIKLIIMKMKIKMKINHIDKATSKTWTRTLDPDPEKRGKQLDVEK